jgi:hypothetical protein
VKVIGFDPAVPNIPRLRIWQDDGLPFAVVDWHKTQDGDLANISATIWPLVAQISSFDHARSTPESFWMGPWR